MVASLGTDVVATAPKPRGITHRAGCEQCDRPDMRVSAMACGRFRAILLALVVSVVLTVWPARAHAAQLSLTCAESSSESLGAAIGRSVGGPGALAEAGTMAPGIATHVDAGRDVAAACCHGARAFDEEACSDYSNLACGTTPPSPRGVKFLVGEGTGRCAANGATYCETSSNNNATPSFGLACRDCDPLDYLSPHVRSAARRRLGSRMSSHEWAMPEDFSTLPVTRTCAGCDAAQQSACPR